MPPRTNASPLALLAAACATSSVQPDAPPPAEEVAQVETGSAVAAAESPAEDPFGGRPYEMVEGEPMVTVLARDAIPALDAPRFVSAEEAFDFMRPEETVLGVVGKDGTAKCYSAWQLDGHEIVNDELDGEPIAATW